jgi:hypothetical protein
VYDTGKIAVGLAIFVCLATFPAWYVFANGKAAYVPEAKIVTNEKECVEPKQYMKEKHMDLLLEWRETVVRNGATTYVSSNGRQFNMSLTGTCLDCHSNKKEFCDQCHDYVGVKPVCWECHNVPPEKSSK